MVSAAIGAVADTNGATRAPRIPSMGAERARTRIFGEKIVDVVCTQRRVPARAIDGPRHASTMVAVRARTAALQIVAKHFDSESLREVCNSTYASSMPDGCAPGKTEPFVQSTGGGRLAIENRAKDQSIDFVVSTSYLFAVERVQMSLHHRNLLRRSMWRVDLVEQCYRLVSISLLPQLFGLVNGTVELFALGRSCRVVSVLRSTEGSRDLMVSQINYA